MENMGVTIKIERRLLLKVVCGGVVAVTGCVGSGGEEQNAQADTSTPTATETPTPTATETPTPKSQTCKPVVQDTIERKGSESWSTEEYLPIDSVMTVTVQTVQGKVPVMDIVSPSGERIVDDMSENPIRYQHKSTQAGEYIVSLRNGALFGENGVWDVEVEICRNWPES
ncbi:hypothetical protein [Haloferax profundi]|uniref:hypothetical protein n=1 Tax=Haloferax profundi TaxID=1544718 RepID=UPI0012F87CF7|nr:hypothetical protein [Haloferax profundi]